MKVTDLYGNPIEITSLKGAVTQTALFKGLGHVNPTPQQMQSDKQRQRYWRDMHIKLLELQSELDNSKLKNE